MRCFPLVIVATPLFLVLPMAADEPAVIDLILVAGQSNAVGYDAKPSDLPADAGDRDILYWWRCGDPPPDNFDSTSGGKWTYLQAVPRGHPDTSNKRPRQYGNYAQAEGGFGPEMGLARTLRAKEGKRLAVVKAAFSGTSLLGDWDPRDSGDRGACYQALVKETRAAIAAAKKQKIRLRVRALAWVQGESDANAGNAPKYEKALAEMIASLRTDLKAPDMRVLLAVNTRFGDDKNPFMPKIVAAQKAVAEKDPRCVYVDTATCAVANDVHFNGRGTLDVGQRMAEALRKLESKGLYQTNAEEWNAPSAGSAGDAPPFPAGKWTINGDGYPGTLEMKLGDGGKVTGTVYGDRIVGWFHAPTGILSFVRMNANPDKPGFQTYKGFLFTNEKNKAVRYTFAGTFVPSDSASELPELGWYAQTGGVDKKETVPTGGVIEACGIGDASWQFNGAGYEGTLTLKIDFPKDEYFTRAPSGELKVTGTVFGSPIVGSYNTATKRISFLRMMDKNADAFQFHTGYLFANKAGTNKIRYTFAGTFHNPVVSGQQGSWYAHTTADMPPISGKYEPGVELIDAVMMKHLLKSGNTAGAFAVTVGRDHRVRFSRGYGWSDWERRKPFKADTPMQIASCTKAITAAIIKKLAREGKLDLNASIFKVWDVKPAGKVIDKRIHDITIQRILAFKAGWQEPFDDALKAYNGGKSPVEVAGIMPYMMVQKLPWTPGEKEVYDSFGYNVLFETVTKVTGKPWAEYLRHQLCRPMGIQELKWVRWGAPQKGEPPPLWNAFILEDPEYRRTAVSMPALATYMSCYFQIGDPRDDKPTNTSGWGGWANCASGMVWSSENVNIAYAFNGRLPDQAACERELHEAIGRLLQAGKLRPR